MEKILDYIAIKLDNIIKSEIDDCNNNNNILFITNKLVYFQSHTDTIDSSSINNNNVHF